MVTLYLKKTYVLIYLIKSDINVFSIYYDKNKTMIHVRY